MIPSEKLAEMVGSMTNEELKKIHKEAHDYLILAIKKNIMVDEWWECFEVVMNEILRRLRNE